LVVVSELWSVGLAVASTSTRLFGSTYPATPITSSTRTETARMPSGIIGGSPAPASFEASLVGSSGSFFTIGEITPRPMSSSVVVKAPSGACPSGNCAMRRSSAFSAAPSGRSEAATTTGWVLAAACDCGWLFTRL
jgi:hypothetical protein